MIGTRLATALLLCVALFRAAQGQTAVVTRNVNLRAGPSTSNQVIRLLRPPDELVVLDPQQQHGYYEVRTAGGSHGWVWSRNVRLTPGAPPAIRDSAPPDAGPPEIYRGCPLEGSAVPEEYRASNRKKNRLTAPSPADIDSTATLPALLGAGRESDWSDSRGASIVGFVIDVKPGGEETVNCGDTALPYRDTHIEVLWNSTDTRKIVRLIVEVTPRWRAYRQAHGMDWSTPRLQQDLEGHWVRFTGWLFWDFSHADEAELSNPGGVDNWRATAWEIHPVTEIKVCPGSPQTCE